MCTLAEHIRAEIHVPHQTIYRGVSIPVTLLIIPRLTISDKMSVWIFCYKRQIGYFDAGSYVVLYFVNGYSVVDISSLDILSYILKKGHTCSLVQVFMSRNKYLPPKLQ